MLYTIFLYSDTGVKQLFPIPQLMIRWRYPFLRLQLQYIEHSYDYEADKFFQTKVLFSFQKNRQIYWPILQLLELLSLLIIK